MRVQRIRAVQAHPVPETLYRPGSIWSPEITKTPVVVDAPEEDLYPTGATPANGMQGVPLFRCNHCQQVVAESEIDAHQCS